MEHSESSVKRLQTTRTLIGGWRFKEAASRGTSPASDLPWMSAEVPGHVHLDLQKNGVIPDPFYRMQERGVAWVDQRDWVYETTFSVTEPVAPTTVLHFLGLDTIAEITLNGESLGQTDNMFIPHAFDVASRLRVGEGERGLNTLQVVFRSALKVGRARQQKWNEAGNDTAPFNWNSWGERSFVRKAQYMYGWDWGPELISCGIWRPVELEMAPIARFLDWSYSFEPLPDGRGQVRVRVFVERAHGARERALTVSAALGGLTLDGRELHGASAQVAVPEESGRIGIVLTLTVDSPELWWPNGHGAPENVSEDGSSDGARLSAGPFRPNLYSLDLCLRSGEVVDRRHARIGLRTVELVQEPDPDGQGRSFKFRVNGYDLFARGANWIPADSFPARYWRPGPDEERTLGTLLKQAARAHFNMLRVWGGGLYESEKFYSLCDELGILVWQDFPYGCAYYPDTGQYAERAREEAVAAIRRLRCHPSLALWCGNNENHQMHHDGWLGRDHSPPRLLGEKLYHDVLPQAVQEEDPGRAYWPSSPFGGQNPNSQNEGDRHDWDVWHGVGDWTHYPEDHSRFVSEFGFASSCGMAVWDAALAPEDRWPRSPVVQWHDKTRKGYETYLGYIRLHFPDPQTLEDLVYYSQLNQAEAMKCALEHWRGLKGQCWGTLYWQLNDCWPVQSWASIDSLSQPKAAYYAIQRAYAPVLLKLERSGQRIEARLVSDLPTALRGQLILQICTTDGDVIRSETINAEVLPFGVGQAGGIDVGPQASGMERRLYVSGRYELDDDSLGRIPCGLRVATLRHIENLLFLAEPRDLERADPGVEVRVHDEKKGVLRIELSAKRFAPYVWLRVDDYDPIHPDPFSDNFFHLLPGREKSIIFRPTARIRDVDSLRGQLKLRTL